MNSTSLLGHTQELLGIIRSSSKPADSLIDTFFRSHKYLGSHDRRFIAETTYGTLRHWRRSAWLLERYVQETDLLPDDRLLLVVAAYLIAIESWRDVTAEAVAAKLKGTRIREDVLTLLSLLRNAAAELPVDTVERIGIQHSFPDWIVRRLIEELSLMEAERIFTALNEPAPLTIRVNTLKATRDECQQALRSQGVESVPTKLSPFGLVIPKRVNLFTLDAFRNGWFEVQDEGSQLLPMLIDPKPTDKVLDACAGAGGKTLEFSALMKNRGEIVAADVHGYRLDQLRKRARRADAHNIRVRSVADLSELTEEFREAFDIVLVDAPCSGLGTIRRNPGMKWMVTEKTVSEVADKQRNILASVASVVKPGGMLVYATCTFLKQENEAMVAAFLEAHPEFRATVPRVAIEGVHPASSGFIKLMPHVHGTDGFFFALLERGNPSA